jgi:hypothetical protein
MKNFYPTVTIFIGLILSISYFLFILSNVKEKTWDTATTFVTTILSIVIGAMISIIIYQYQNQNENQQKLSEMRRNLESELSDIQRVLTSGEVITINSLPFLTTYIQPIIVDECAKSGLFLSRDVENLLHISRKIKFYDVQVNYFLSILTNSDNPQFPNILMNCNKNMETSRLSIIQDINQIKNQLNLTLSNSINFK